MSTFQRLIEYFLDLFPSHRALKEQVYVDPLTGVGSRRAFNKAILNEMSRVKRGMGKPLSVALLDVDFFKGVNDNFGHPIGDEVLATLGRILSNKTRSTDFVGRYGGEEFVFILPTTSREGALRHIETIRATIERDLWVHTEVDGTLVTVSRTASFGLVTWDEEESAETLIARADAALYAAKSAGRNRVVQV